MSPIDLDLTYSSEKSASPLHKKPRHTSSLVYHLDLLCHLVRRDFTLRYKQSVLGVLWSLVLPLAQLIVLVFLFNIVVPLKIDAYPAFVFSALLPWTWFSTCLGSAGNLFIQNRDLVRRPLFAPVILIIVNTLSNLLNYVVAMPILFGILIFYDKDLTWALLSLPLLILIQGILIVSLGLIIATLNVFYRDVQHMMSMVLMLLFYLTPVFYRSQSAAENYRILYTYNPLATLIQNYRAIFLYGTFPEWTSLLFAGIASVVLCCFSYLMYCRYLHDVIDTI